MNALGAVVRGFGGTGWHHVFSGGGALSDVPTRPYSQVGVVFACVQAKANALSRLPMMVSDADDQVIETGPLVELSECPNPRMTWRQFVRTTSAYLDLFGRCGWRVVMAGRTPVEVWPLMPSRLVPRVNEATGEVVGWTYRNTRGGVDELAAEEVVYFNDPDFEGGDELGGLSPRQAATHAIDQVFKADLANIAGLDNTVEPGGTLTVPGQLTEAQRSNMRDQIRSERQGVRNRKRFMVLEGDMKLDPTASSFRDMEFPTLKGMAQTDVFAAYGVPPAVAGYFSDSNYAHANAAEEGFWSRTVMPRAEWIAEQWTAGVLARFNGDRSLAVAEARSVKATRRETIQRGYTASRRGAIRSGQRFFGWLDAGGVEAVQRAQMGMVEQAEKWNKMGVPLNAILQATNAPFADVPWGDTWHRPAGLMDVRETFIGDPDGGPDGPQDAEPAEVDAGAARGRSGAGGAPVAYRASEAVLGRLWEAWRVSWRGLEVSTRKTTQGHFRNLRRGVLQRLEATPETQLRSFSPDTRRDVIANLLFDLAEARDGLRVRVQPLIREAARLGGEQAVQEAAEAEGSDTPTVFSLSDPGVAAKLEARDVKILDVNRTIRRQVAKALAVGFEAGESKAELADRIRQQFNFAHRRAESIARTEVGAAVEEARTEGRRQAGVPLRSWLWSRRETGRPNHAQTERDTLANPIGADEPFTISGTSITCDHPRAANLPASESINCGCTTIGRYPGDQIRAVLGRYLERGFLSYEQLQRRDAAPTKAA